MKHGQKQDSVTFVQKNNNNNLYQAIKLHLGGPDEGNKDFKAAIINMFKQLTEIMPNN